MERDVVGVERCSRRLPQWPAAQPAVFHGRIGFWMPLHLKGHLLPRHEKSMNLFLGVNRQGHREAVPEAPARLVGTPGRTGTVHASVDGNGWSGTKRDFTVNR